MDQSNKQANREPRGGRVFRVFRSSQPGSAPFARSTLVDAARALSGMLRLVSASTLCALAAAPLQASMELPEGQVGQVTLVLGKAWIAGPDGGRQLIRTGTPVSVSDTITTASGGHVHVRFVDTALVSIRPSSVMEIVRYDFDPARPADSAVKLNLIEGETRAVSGAAAKNARENFRMNTPIAAIGVRGTDFSVIVKDDKMQVVVTEGAVVVAPFSGDCLAEALGPCSATGLELGMNSSQILQFNANNGEPVLLPAASSELAETLVDSNQSPATAATSTATEPERDGDGELYVDSVGSRAVNQRITTARNQPRPEAPATPVTPPVTPPVQLPVEPPAPLYTPVQLASAEALISNNQLVWGRYAYADITSERITVDAQLAEDRGFQGTVGNNVYALYRLELDGRKLVQPGLGVLGFTLNQAQAVFKSGGAAELMSVFGGQLNINFEERTFATALQLGHAATGPITFSDSGRIFDYGNFFNRGETQNIYGSVSVDGSEAGYYFDKTLDNGKIEGLTLWGRQP
jgi:hypothetical protein